MKYEDFKKDTAYTVVSGTNANLTAGDLFWIDSVAGALNLAGGHGGWIDKEDIHDTFFGGLDICEAKDYHVITLSNGNTQIFHDSLVSMKHSRRNRIPIEEDTKEDRSGWIKVTPETMPPELNEIMVSIENFDSHTRYVWPSKARYRNGTFEVRMSDGFASGWDRPAFYDIEVTHWMPWPEPAED